MDRSYGSCRKLVTYISDNMATSPGFIEQMDRIILACFSGASKRVLSSVATQEVWFRASEEEEEEEVEEAREVMTALISRRGPRGRVKPIEREAASDDVVIKQERVEGTSATPRATAAGGTAADGAGSLLEKRPRSRTSKKKLSTKKPLQELVVAEPKKAARRRAELSSAEESVEADTGTDEGGEERKRPKKRMVPRQHEDVVNSALPVEDEQGLLTFKEAIGELCYQERRSPEQTDFFKERLRKSIQFVDALLCRPPPGKMCTRTCSKIRGSMCKSTAPCQDKMCRIWHDVEAHTDRCKNSKCEFKLRILVRETMYKRHSKQLAIKNASQKLRKKNATLDELNATELSEPGTFAEAIVALESEIEILEQGLITEEAEMAEINGTLEKYWATLNEIGIEWRHDSIDNFPEFVTHYANKKKRK
ncbi:hypothetical protein PC121_g15690 [Phytophthora cactorum]|nr:hypothetical protein PC120_g10736 [Phytophthora cactorum]KAG3055586.1 hypothetical protein PC121_g15690 [Phytophthora cactorum]KAG4050141.1 hypothetical protein PC123_g14611 [Phytophthora cactorum]